MKHILYAVVMTSGFLLHAEHEQVILKDAEYRELIPRKESHISMAEDTTPIKRVLLRIASFFKEQEYPQSFKYILDRINMDYITAPFYSMKAALESAYDLVEHYMHDLLDPQEKNLLKKEIEDYYRSINDGKFFIALESEAC